MDDFDPSGADEGRELFCANLLACHTILYDNTNPDAGYSLARVIVHVRPADGGGFPFRLQRVCLFAQLHGAPGEYLLRVRTVRIDADGDGEAETEVRTDGPWDVLVPGDNYVECFGLILPRVMFSVAGVYEFQLWADGFDAPLGRERVQARE